MALIKATDGDRVLDDPSDEQLHDLLADMNLSCNFVIVERLDRGGEHYIQVALSEEPNYGSYQVEYRDGRPDAHFEATVLRDSDWDSILDHGFERVMQVVCDWVADNARWRTALPWKPLVLSNNQ
ncbi:hypothetical protein VFPPC_05627 [Pochonia chlamydosporia 170]|uniref:Uncharacterized protein n=1 Tax=Pochonia chlamydosporia 170 TaxID=1380566 RepID=A0A179FFG7_METCM|nr:hypothetical protein VFPPC_05627 [Pochonia chlamydosporia 170]OAQ64345.1 hypothetical protein VFPPC_05627 [Pochonia chlamydosporia 170]